MARHQVSRRGVLGGALGALGLSATASHAADLPHSEAEHLLRIFSDRHAAAEIGHRHLATRTQRPQAAEVVARLVQRLPDTPSRLSPDILTEALRAQVEADFAARRFARVDGWVLAETEMRLAVLAALTP